MTQHGPKRTQLQDFHYMTLRMLGNNTGTVTYRLALGSMIVAALFENPILRS